MPFAGIGPATSPLPRGCSTTEPKGRIPCSPCKHFATTADRFVERETGIEPASLAWKARVLPLNYSRERGKISVNPRRLSTALHKSLQSIANPQKRLGGGGWIRTSVGVSQQIYSLPPLATRAPLRRTSKYTTVWKARPGSKAAKTPRRRLALPTSTPTLTVTRRRSSHDTTAARLLRTAWACEQSTWPFKKEAPTAPLPGAFSTPCSPIPGSRSTASAAPAPEQ